MTNVELNQYIKHYIEQDKTCSAIMLTAPWGAGKSYYIQHELLPYLQDEKNGSHSCIVLSLYGISSLAEISKALYFECRLGFIKKDSELYTTGRLVAKTFIKGVTSAFNIDLSGKPEDYQKVYESIDLRGKLIILEDLERSGVGILEILGYVNSLVEQDGVKVLLVANEEELIKREPITVNSDEDMGTAMTMDTLSDHKGREYTKTTQRYLETKEKTVSDTVQFIGDLPRAVRQIMAEYNQDYFGCFSIDSEIDEIISLFNDNGISNLRTYKYACQKANDIFQLIKQCTGNEPDNDFLKTIFYSIISFSQKLKSGKESDWKDQNDLSVSLSSEKYPLFRFIYEYIKQHSFDDEKIEPAKNLLKQYRLYDKNKSGGDPDLLTLYNWLFNSEKDVVAAVDSITTRLEKEDDISFFDYGRIAEYLIIVKYNLNCEIELAKERLIKNLYNKSNVVNVEYLFSPVFDCDNDDLLQEINEIKRQIKESLFALDTPVFGFDYQPSSIMDLFENVQTRQNELLAQGVFTSRLDLEKLVEMIKQCNAEQLHDLRGVFLKVYRSGYILKSMYADKDAVKELCDAVSDLKDYERFDKVQKIQIGWFINCLNTVYSSFERAE